MALKIFFTGLVILTVSLAMVSVDGASYGYNGCFREGSNGRALTNKQFSRSDMTVDSCRSLCDGDRFYGVEYGTECYCGTVLGDGAYQVPDSACNTPCGGNPSQTCGGNSLLSLYKNNFTSQRPLYNYQNLGCYAEPAGGRALDRVLSGALMTVDKCLILCSYASFTYAGLEFGNECWCGDTLNAAAQPSNASSCSMPCAGNASETCGGSAMLDVYTITAPSSTPVSLRAVDGLGGDRDELARILAEEIL